LVTSDLTISDQLTLNGGNIDAATNSKTVIVSNNTAAAIARTSGYVIGDLERAFTTGVLPTISVGTGVNEYSPVNIKFTSGAFTFPASITVRAFNTKHQLAGLQLIMLIATGM